MNTKNILAAIVVMLFCISLAIGQHKPDKEKIKALKTAFITERLELSNKEAQAFWLVYNKYELKKEQFHQKERKQIHSIQKNTTALSDNEAKDLITKYITIEEEKHQMRTNLIKEISTVVSAKKTFLLIKAEKDFRRELIKIHRQKRMEERKK